MGADRRLASGVAIGLAGWVLYSTSLAAERVQWAPAEARSGIARAIAGLARAVDAAGLGAAEGGPWSAAFAFALLAAGASWILVVGSLRAGRVPLAPVLALAAVFAAVAGAAPGLLSSDVYAYVRLGRMWALFDLNPFVLAPIAAPDAYVDDRWFMAEHTSPYGPLWIGFAALLARLADLLGLDFFASLQLYRWLGTGFHLANAALVHRIGEALRPGSGPAAAATYALCPLAIVEGASNAHNDVVAAFLVLLALAQQLRSRTFLASTLFAAAGLVKPYALLAWVAHAALVARSSPTRAAAVRRTLAIGLLAAALAAAAYLPFWEGSGTLAGLRTLLGLLLGLAPTNSLSEWLGAQVLARVLPAGTGLRIASLLGAAAFAATFALLLARIRDASSFRHACLGGFFAWSAFGASWNQPWYALLALAIAAIAPPSRLRAATLLLSLSVLAIYPLYALDLPALYAHRGLVMGGLPLAVLGLGSLRRA